MTTYNNYDGLDAFMRYLTVGGVMEDYISAPLKAADVITDANAEGLIDDEDAMSLLVELKDLRHMLSNLLRAANEYNRLSTIAGSMIEKNKQQNKENDDNRTESESGAEHNE